ncbi:MAG: SRPBCC domain-containing protein, partial [Ferrovibrio sp.]
MNAMTNLQTAATRELSLTREIDAPAALVYKAWTEHLTEWFAPRPLTTTAIEIDFRAGGRFQALMKDPATAEGGGPEYP